MNRAERFSIQVWFHRGHEVLDRSLGHEVLDRAFPGPPRPIMAHHGPSRPLMAPGPRMAPGLPARVPMGARGCEKLKGGPGPAAGATLGHSEHVSAILRSGRPPRSPGARAWGLAWPGGPGPWPRVRAGRAGAGARDGPRPRARAPPAPPPVTNWARARLGIRPALSRGSLARMPCKQTSKDPGPRRRTASSASPSSLHISIIWPFARRTPG